MDELIPTRATLLERLRNWQDQSSWQDFFDTYWKLIYTVARKGGLTDTEAQDVVQETMVSVAKHMPSFQYDPAIGSFKAWLLNMTRWRMRDQFRKRHFHRKYRLKDVEDLEGHDPNPVSTELEAVDPMSANLDTLWEAQWEENVFEAALAKVKRQVDPRQFQIFDLYFNKQWAPAKVAEAFGVNVSQVYMAKHRIAALLKEEVKRIEQNMM